MTMGTTLNQTPVPTLSELETLRFATLSEVKAKLSEYVRALRPRERRVVITVAGKPAAVLIAYDEFVARSAAAPTEKVIQLEDWRRQRPERERVRDSILSMFDLGSLSRKGQKRYKRDRVRAQRP